MEVEVVDDENGIPSEEILEILSGDALTAVMDELKSEYDKAKSLLDARNTKIRIWRKNMEAIASDAPKNKPIKNASNVTIPVTQTVTQSLYAQILGTFLARDPFWTVEGVNSSEDLLKKYKVIEKYLNLLVKSPSDLGIAWLYDLVDETLLAGGAFPKVTYDVNSWRVMAQGGSDKEVVYHDGPTITVLPMENVVYPRGVPSIARLPWISMDTQLTEMELRERASKGIYDPKAVEAILGEKRTSPTDMEEQEQIAEQFNSGETTGLYDISEVYFYHDVQGDGVPVDLMFTVHFGTGQVLRQQYNSIGMRCLTSSKYAHRSRSIVGRGTGQMTESFQSEITALHNLRTDNAKIAGMRMIITKRGKFGMKREIYPGAVWEADNPKEDVAPMQLGEVYPSSLQAENMDWSLVHRATGLSETQMGFADSTLGSRDTARGQAMRVQRGDTILGSAVEGLKFCLSQIGMLVWMQCVANKDRVIAREKEAMRLTEDEQATLADALEMDITSVPLKLQFIVKTTEAEKTYEQRRMNVMTLNQIFAQFAQQTVPLAMQLFGPQGMQMKQQAPQMWEYMGRILVGSGKLMEDTFKFFGTMDVNNYIVDPEKLDALMDQMASFTGQTFIGAPGGMAAGPGQQEQPGQPQAGAMQLPEGTEQPGGNEGATV